MEITELPFNKLIGLNHSEQDVYILTLKDDPKYTNHLGTVHAAALFALAEATAGQFLLTQFPEYSESIIAVVRKSEVKYKKPAMGQINSIASITVGSIESISEQLKTKNRAMVQTKVELFDQHKTNVMTADFEWFVSK